MERTNCTATERTGRFQLPCSLERGANHRNLFTTEDAGDTEDGGGPTVRGTKTRERWDARGRGCCYRQREQGQELRTGVSAPHGTVFGQLLKSFHHGGLGVHGGLRRFYMVWRKSCQEAFREGLGVSGSFQVGYIVREMSRLTPLI